MIRNRKVTCKTLEEFNSHMQRANDICFKVFFEKYEQQPIRQNAYFEETPKFFKLTYKLFKTKFTYVLDRNGEYKESPDTLHIMSEFAKVYPIQKVSEYMPQYVFDETKFKDGKVGYRMCIGSASPIKDSNKNFRNKATEGCYEYDMSNAYGQFLRLQLPDLRTVQYNTEVKPGQVGFDWYESTLYGYPRLVMYTQPGAICKWVFDLMESPYREWCDKIIAQLKVETDKNKRDRLKNKFRIAVGQLQSSNPFWRAYIVESCNILNQKLRDNNSIYWSTDSIVSATKRDDILESGFNWSIKNQGTFKLKGRLDHQWNDEIPVVSGIKKLYIKSYNRTHAKPFDLIKDEMPTTNESVYMLDKEQFKIVYNKEIEEYE